MTVDAFARFDVLYMLRRLAQAYDAVTEGEVHTLAYLAALLSIYGGRAPHWWGYLFHRVDPAAPFSEAISEATRFDVRVGLLVQRNAVLSLSKRGESEVGLWLRLPVNDRRTDYLEAACAAALQLSLPSVGQSLQREPQISQAAELSSERQLLTPFSLPAFHDQLDAVTRVLQSQSPDFTPSVRADLPVAAVVWLEYLRMQDRDTTALEIGRQ